MSGGRALMVPGAFRVYFLLGLFINYHRACRKRLINARCPSVHLCSSGSHAPPGGKALDHLQKVTGERGPELRARVLRRQEGGVRGAGDRAAGQSGEAGGLGPALGTGTGPLRRGRGPLTSQFCPRSCSRGLWPEDPQIVELGGRWKLWRGVPDAGTEHGPAWVRFSTEPGECACLC